MSRQNGISRDALAAVILSHELQAASVHAAAEADRELAGSLGWDHDWLAEHCLGDGFDPHRLLAAPGGFTRERSASMSGEIRDGRGYHPMATFSWEART